MAQVRYAVVFGKKDTADRFFPFGEFYIRDLDLEGTKALFKSLPSEGIDGDYVVRIYERYYDKHLEPDLNYEKSEFTIECNQVGLNKIFNYLLDRE